MSPMMFRFISLTIASIMLLASQFVFADDSQDSKDKEQDNSASLSLSADTDGISANADSDSNIKRENRPTHQKFNLHLALGGAYGLGDNLKDNEYGNIGVAGSLGFDIVLAEPLAISVLGGFNHMMPVDEYDGISTAFVGAGLRLRLFSDNNGALFDDGTIAGNLWIDAHFGYAAHLHEDYGTYDIGLGYEFAVFKDINIGPYARFQHIAFGGDSLTYMVVSVGLAMSIGANSGPGDIDNDGIMDDVDQCKNDPEDKDGFEDEDGCPDLDNDNDGILDVDDKCPNVAGIADRNGCPNNDSDGDGIANEEDKCPEEAEDKDEFEDEDGCPDPDNDNDGVLDADDKCPTEIEDKDEFEDEDGCPDPDNDNDGVLDADDKCPNEAETVNGKDDEDGCPDLVRVEKGQIKILEKVHFTTGKSKILKDSFELLNQVASVIKGKPDIKVRIEGHTDDKGKDAKNLKLSKSRAESVMNYLMKQDVKSDQLSSEGKGETAPVGDNKTKEGRAENRRVEFHIEKITPTN